jgi:hypothetical protein
MIIPANRERYHYGDYSYFIHDKDEDIYKQRSTRNQCLDLISSLIEVYGDLAVESILTVVESLLSKPQSPQVSDEASTSTKLSQ